MYKPTIGFYICLVFLISLLCNPGIAYADCTGCCSGNGGVVCKNRITMCADGTSLSEECMKKECIKCPQGFFDGLDKDGIQKGIEIPDLRSSSAAKFVFEKVVNSSPKQPANGTKKTGFKHTCGPFDGKIKKCLYRGKLVYMNFGYPSIVSTEK